MERRVVGTAAQRRRPLGGTHRTRPGCPAALPAGSREPGPPSGIDDRAVLVAEHDLSRPLSDLVTAERAIGEAAAD